MRHGPEHDIFVHAFTAAKLSVQVTTTCGALHGASEVTDHGMADSWPRQAVDRIDLGPLTRWYGVHSRSLRMFRGLAGSGTLVVAVGPCVLLLALPFISDPALALAATVALAVAMLVGILAIHGYESVAAGSLWAIRSAIVMLAALAAMRIVVVGDALAQARWRWEITVPVLMGMALNLTVLWLLVRGLLPVARLSRNAERELFRIHVRERAGFFRPIAGLVQDMCRMGGLVVPPNGRKSDRLAVCAALAAFALEGSVYYAYLQAGFNLSRHARKLDATDFPVAAAMALLAAGPLITLALGRACFALSRQLRSFALRRSLATAAELQRDDVRPPVAFLRSFRDDQVALAEAPIPLALKFFDSGVEVRTLEALVVRTMTSIGPVIAIGNPADQRPPLGAARNYLQDADWRLVVRSLIMEARLVVVGLDDTGGVQWELAELAASGALWKTVVIVPPVPIEVQRRYLRALAEAVKRPITICSAGMNTIGVLFGAGERVMSLVSRRVSELEYDVAVRLAMHWNAADQFAAKNN